MSETSFMLDNFAMMGSPFPTPTILFYSIHIFIYGATHSKN